MLGIGYGLRVIVLVEAVEAQVIDNIDTCVSSASITLQMKKKIAPELSHRFISSGNECAPFQ